MTVTVRDAATVMLVRDAVDDDGAPTVEVCMLQRNLASEFVAGAYVFPGGSVDPSDRTPEAAAVCRGLTDAEASAALGITAGGLAFYVAALRECFEEAGVLVAVDVADGGAGARRCSTPTIRGVRRASRPTARRSTRGGPGWPRSAAPRSWRSGSARCTT